MKVLLIAFHFAPDPAVGAIRAGRVARALVARAHDVHVLAGPFPDVQASLTQGGITVERPEPILDPRRLYARLQGRRKDPIQSSANAPDGKNEVWTQPRSVHFWKRHLVSLLWLPDDRQGWMAAAVRRAFALGIRNFDVIYTTAPPFSAHLAGLALRRKRGNTRWFAEFRDPWTDNPAKPESGRTRWSDAANRWLEKACLRRADGVVCVAESVAEILQKSLGSAGGKVHVVRNGIENFVHQATPSPGNGRVLYAGNLYHGRDPRPFLRGLAVLASNGQLADGFAVDFVGDCNHFQGVDILSFSSEIGLGSIVNVGRPVSHDRALEMMQNASVLLLLAQDQPLQVPNKLYEYLGTGRSILAFADRSGETASMLRKVGGHVVLDSDDPETIGAGILEALQVTTRPGADADQLLSDWSTDSQFSYLVDLIERRERHAPEPAAVVPAEN